MDKVVWKIGDDKLELNKSKIIPRWVINKVVIFPHISIDEYLNYDEMKKLASETKKKLENDGYKCILYDRSSYTRELNGPWNVVLGIKHIPEGKKKEYQAMYLFRNDTLNKYTYGCPFYNEEYIYQLFHYSANMNNEIIEKLEKHIKEINPKFKTIKTF